MSTKKDKKCLFKTIDVLKNVYYDNNVLENEYEMFLIKIKS
ncbi:hypothetical protein CNEO3_200049 [Clostridium neonatale]|nr:hypothetical protein CNEO3_200049 [Clostridium neonatale]